MLSKISVIFEIRVLIYRIGICTDQNCVISKLAKFLEVSLAASMNVITNNSQIKHCACPKYVAIKRSTL